MFLAKVKKRIIATSMHMAYQNKTVFAIQPVKPDGSPDGELWIAMDYVGANIDDLVVCGGAPGVAQEVFHLDRAPIRTLIMAIVDKLDYRDID